MLPLTFADAADYDKVAPTDRVSILGLTELAPGKQLTLQVRFRHACLCAWRGRGCSTSVQGLTELAPGKQLTLQVSCNSSYHKTNLKPPARTIAPSSMPQGKRADGSTYTLPLLHTFNDNQIQWFKAGSALNQMAREFATAKA